MKNKLYINEVTTFRVIDGDTIECTVSIGFNIFTKIVVRFADFDAPETRGGTKDKKRLGMAYKLATEIFLLKAQRAGKLITVQTSKKGKFGRWIGTFYINKTKVTENKQLMKLVEEIHVQLIERDRSSKRLNAININKKGK